MTALKINFQSIHLTDEQFFQLCQDNHELRLERSANGELIVIPPTGGETGNRSGKITQQLFNWTEIDGTGIAFDSSTGFKLPNGANRSPDASWVTLTRWNSLTDEQKEKFIPLCPDFALELLSPTDSLKVTQEKMKEYIDNGTKLAWLINCKTKQVEIYRPNQAVTILDCPTNLSGEDILPGFVLDLKPIW